MYRLIKKGEYYHIIGDERAVMGVNYNFGLDKVDLLPTYYAKHSTEWNCCFKMIASTKYIKGVYMISENEINVLLGIVDVEDEAIAYAEKEDGNMIPSLSDKGIGKMHGFIDGYQRALKDNIDKKFTVDDMNYAIKRAYGYVDNEGWSIDYITEQIQKELNKEKTEWQVELETEVVADTENRDRDNDGQVFNNMKKIQPAVKNGYVKILNIK